MTESHKCEHCDKVFEYTDNDVCEWHDELSDGTPFTAWDVTCPHCGNNCRVGMF